MTTKKVVTDDKYIDIHRKLHVLDGQLLLRNGYPFDVNRLEAILQRLTEGYFYEDAAPYCRVSVRGGSVQDCLARFAFVNNRERPFPMLEGVELARPTAPYEFRTWSADVTTERLQRVTCQKDIEAVLKKRGLEPADFYESCAWLAVNRLAQSDGPILCLDELTCGGKAIMLIFTGGNRRGWGFFTRERMPDESVCAHVRVLARVPAKRDTAGVPWGLDLDSDPSSWPSW